MALEKNLKPLKLIQVKLIISGFSSKVKLGYENLGRMTMGEVAKKYDSHAFTQFELSKIVLNNLKHFNLTPTGKLVLLVLVDCYNPQNGSVVFPSIEFIAEKIGVGLTATKQAIKDLILEGLIIKSKRGKIQGNYNKYLLTPKVQNPTSEQSENEFFKQSHSDRLYIEQKKENKKPTNDECLIKYAESRGVKNKVAYINAIKRNGGDLEIVNEMKQAEINKTFMQNEVKRFIENDRENRKNAVEPPKVWKELKLKLGGMNYVDRGMEL